MPKVRRFTNAAISRLKLPRGKSQVDFFENLTAGRSLVLTLNKSGKRSWSALFYEHGKPRRKKLGEHPDMSPKEARDAALKLDSAKTIAAKKAGTFEHALERYLQRDVRKRGLLSADEVERLLRKNVLPKWRSRKVGELTRRDVNDLLDELEDSHTPGVANSTLAVLSAFFSWLVSNDDMPNTPIVRRMRRSPAVRRARTLNDDEIRALWWATDDGSTYSAIIRVLLLTGQRRAKVVALRWSDLDLETRTWSIPRHVRGKNVPQAITLPQSALNVIAAQPRIAGNPHVFAGRGGAHFGDWSKSKHRLDAAMLLHLRAIAKATGRTVPVRFTTKAEEKDPDRERKPDEVEHWQPNDLRRSCRTIMADLGINRDTGEAALGHALPGVEGTYNRSKQREQIDRALKAVESYIKSSIVNPDPDNVVQLQHKL